MKLSPDVELQDPHGRSDMLHVCVTQDYDADLWVMACGVSTIADDDGNLSPDIDFYEENAWFKATCKRCRALYEQKGN